MRSRKVARSFSCRAGAAADPDHARLVAARKTTLELPEIAAAEQALAPVAGSPSPYFLLRLTGFLREAAARLAPRA